MPNDVKQGQSVYSPGLSLADGESAVDKHWKHVAKALGKNEDHGDEDGVEIQVAVLEKVLKMTRTAQLSRNEGRTKKSKDAKRKMRAARESSVPQTMETRSTGKP